MRIYLFQKTSISQLLKSNNFYEKPVKFMFFFVLRYEFCTIFNILKEGDFLDICPKVRCFLNFGERVKLISVQTIININSKNVHQINDYTIIHWKKFLFWYSILLLSTQQFSLWQSTQQFSLCQ